MDDTDLRAAILKLEAENRRLWTAMDELMRDQTSIERRLERLEKKKQPTVDEKEG